ncbi:MAG TPA: SpoIIE family protein phosphatase [Sporichthyaceae bacterium]|jgi:serine phosphatase RsbU (regulator of sigma subunit)|nr:SpoIIE family protein phosphatase [Sporichthyaceae bacterium]
MAALGSDEADGRTGRWEAAVAASGAVCVLLIEDDAGDALLVREMLAEAAPDADLVWARSLAEARELLALRPACVLLDLQLPDSFGLSGLDAVLAAAPGAAVIVLTGLADQHLGVRAVALGAQDYLAKGQVEPQLLARAIRYSVERRAAQETSRELAEARLLAAENARLERGLLPVAIVPDDTVGVVSRYRAGGLGLLGGDFFDVVQCPDGTAYALIGDVCGHGPDEAALGVCLRVAWRTLILSGSDEHRILPVLAEVLGHERAQDHVFATVCMVRVANDFGTARVYLAGHPPPILDGELLDIAPGVPLGIRGRFDWQAAEVKLGARWELVLYTDGIFEGRVGPGQPLRLGLDGFAGLLRAARESSPDPRDWTDAVIGRVESNNGGPLTDDLALLVLTHAPAAPPR